MLPNWPIKLAGDPLQKTERVFYVKPRSPVRNLTWSNWTSPVSALSALTAELSQLPASSFYLSEARGICQKKPILNHLSIVHP